MDCSRFQEDMMDVLYGEADPATAARFQAHRERCAECRDEVSGLQRVRRDMQAWRFDMPRARRRVLPGLRGLAAAAAVVMAFGGGLAIARTEMRYRDGELVVRFGGGGAPVRAAENGTELAQRMARLESQHRAEMQEIKAALAQPVPTTGNANQDALLRRVQLMIRESEARQRYMVEADLSDLAAQHQRDLVMISTSFSQLRQETAADIERLGSATQRAADQVLRIKDER